MIRLSLKTCICVVITISLMIPLFLTKLFLQITPEISHYVYSTCANPSRVYENPKIDRIDEITRPYRLQNLTRPRDSQKPVIFVGTHHKTGTFLAKKIFSVICARLRLCCIIQPSRYTESKTLDNLKEARPDLLGHLSWQWFPEELAENYRFVHFYRGITKKVVSGYRYHADGVENWTNRPSPWFEACSQNPEEKCQRLYLGKHGCKAILGVKQSDLKRHPDMLQRGNLINKGDSLICRHAAKMGIHTNKSTCPLSETLNAVSLEEGLLIEAGIEFYEDLNMAKIVNHTSMDPRSLNIDLDKMMQNFDLFLRKILNFVDLHDGDTSLLESLVEDITFFDINHSPLYKLAMETPVFNHVATTKNVNFDKKAAVKFLLENSEFQGAYQPIIQLMEGSTI